MTEADFFWGTVVAAFAMGAVAGMLATVGGDAQPRFARLVFKGFTVSAFAVLWVALCLVVFEGLEALLVWAGVFRS